MYSSVFKRGNLQALYLSFTWITWNLKTTITELNISVVRSDFCQSNSAANKCTVMYTLSYGHGLIWGCWKKVKVK